MSKIVIIGAGGVGRVVTHKCAQLSTIFTEIILASRTLKKCDDIATSVRAKYKEVKISTTQVDADEEDQIIHLFEANRPFLVIKLHSNPSSCVIANVRSKSVSSSVSKVLIVKPVP